VNFLAETVKLGNYMWAEVVEKKSKTQVWQVKAKGDDSNLGVIKWFAPWRQYCLLIDGSVFSADCLRDFASFLEKLNQHHKAR
jgi:hypothetical protein